MDITHDVRVKILKLSEVQALKEPLCPEPDVSRLYHCSDNLI